jgi:16S rRNA (cytosine1402-N4)-methyltransferase
MEYHRSVLLQESVDGLDIKPGGVYLDVTYGGGGHTREILKRLGDGRLLAFDQDEDASKNITDDNRFTLINANFRYMSNFMKFHKADKLDGIIADLGISSFQIDNPERGFSTRFEGNLDMRMDANGAVTAADVLSTYDRVELTKVFREYGELANAYRIAGRICEARSEGPVDTIGKLKELLMPCAERGKENKFFAKVFQALRIEVNDEIGALKAFLTQCPDLLIKGGRLVVISYHSLEDRLVKNYIKTGNFEGTVEKDFYGNQIRIFNPLTRKPIMPSEKEIETNSRARSAKLRIAEKI